MHVSNGDRDGPREARQLELLVVVHLKNGSYHHTERREPHLCPVPTMPFPNKERADGASKGRKVRPDATADRSYIHWSYGGTRHHSPVVFLRPKRAGSFGGRDFRDRFSLSQ